MAWGSIWVLVHVLMLLGWAALALLPRRPATLSFILYACVGGLCLAYAAMFASLFFFGVDPARVAGAAQPDLTDYSIAGIRALFMSDGGVVLGWTHYLALDLFTGLWIAKDADNKGFARLTQLPVLLLTFLAGPIGLLTWLGIREARARKAARNS